MDTRTTFARKQVLFAEPVIAFLIEGVTKHWEMELEYHPWVKGYARNDIGSEFAIHMKPRDSAKFLGQPDEESFGSADVAEPIRVLVSDHFAADKLRAVLTEPDERIVDVVHGKHDA